MTVIIGKNMDSKHNQLFFSYSLPCIDIINHLMTGIECKKKKKVSVQTDVIQAKKSKGHSVVIIIVIVTPAPTL